MNYNEKLLTPERIKRMQQHLLAHPIDPSYDKPCEENFDDNWLNTDLLNQSTSRAEYRILKEIGQLPPGIE
ncbi:hypothetical protein ABI153_07210 [Faecalibacterium prausnitzii]|jgi:hypothetical protein|uniref:hypothetical protein n=1 Tax=Faecalibacterium prausnitzii TaxID=853 RepID=UPI0020685A32|nr:MAG TPA: hypothetical protein [Caudoviricetes sp.]